VRESNSEAAVSPAGPAPMMIAVPVKEGLSDKRKFVPQTCDAARQRCSKTGWYHTAPLMIGPSLTVITALAFVWLGFEIAIRPRKAGTGPLELANAAVTIGAALWIASVWLLALTHSLDRPFILARSAFVLILAVALFMRRTRGHISNQQLDAAALRSYGLPFVPVALWILFVLWRSTIVPPLSHDALAYHLPRAVLWIREHGFAFITLPVDFRMRLLPANYELLLADIILQCGSDAVTEWLGVFFYIAILIAAASLAERWWRGQKDATLTVVLLTASIPVLLLHTGADKNDSMTAFFMLTALTWAGRWFNEADVDALILCGVSVIAAIGTKPQGLMLGAALFPFVAWRVITELRARRMRIATLTRVVAISLMAATLLGGAFFVSRMLHESPASAAERRSFVAYDDWVNLWQAPWILITTPFSLNDYAVYVPWESTPWFWRKYELYFSDLGRAFGFCAIGLPLALFFFRRNVADRARERHAMFIAATITVVLMFPVHDVPMPHGVYTMALPRYVMFFAPALFALTAAPAMTRLRERSPRGAAWVVVAFVALFTFTAADMGLNDTFVPIEYVLVAREHPGTRMIRFDPLRAASVADRFVPPNETICIDAGYAAWIHPAFGANLQRPVKFIANGVIPDEARWIVVDRGFRAVWQHKKFHDLSQSGLYLGRGAIAPEDKVVMNQLRHNPRYKQIFYNGPVNQGVFQRIR